MALTIHTGHARDKSLRAYRSPRSRSLCSLSFPGFSVTELVVSVLIVMGIAAISLPSVNSAVQNYRLHADASAIAGFLNVTRMKAASQYAPYALDVNPTATPVTFQIEQLTGATYNPLSPSGSSYASQATPVYDTSTGMQYASSGTIIAACRPAGISAYPAPVKADPSTCSGPFQFCFNTRGSPVRCSDAGAAAGNPLLTTSGGLAIYITGTTGLADAVTIGVGGAVQVWNWDPSAAKWFLR